MRRLVLCFPGQGAQRPGMGRSLALNFAAARAVFAEVDDALGEHLSRTMFAGSAAELAHTAVTQPALLAHSIAALRVLEVRARARARPPPLAHAPPSRAPHATTRRARRA